MEAQTLTLSGVPGIPASSPAAGVAPQAGPRSVNPGITNEQRRKWREKYYARKARLAGQPISAAPLAPVSPAAGGPGAAPTPGHAVGAVPWDSSPLKPVCAAVIHAMERVNVSNLVEKAALVSPELRALVEREAPWNPESKAALEASSPEAVAQLLNRFGVSSENGPLAISLISLSAIIGGQMILGSKIDKAVEARKAELEERKKEQAKQ